MPSQFLYDAISGARTDSMRNWLAPCGVDQADVRKTAEEKRRFVRALLQAEAGIRNQEIRKRVVAQFGNSIAWRYLEAIRNELSGKPVKKRPRKTIQRNRKARLGRAKPQTQIINAPVLPPQTKNGQAASRLVSGTLEAIELLSGNQRQ